MTAKTERQIIEANANIEVLVLLPGLSSLAIEAKAIEFLSIRVNAFIDLNGRSGRLEFCSLRDKEAVGKGDVCCSRTLKGSYESRLVACEVVALQWWIGRHTQIWRVKSLTFFDKAVKPFHSEH